MHIVLSIRVTQGEWGIPDRVQGADTILSGIKEGISEYLGTLGWDEGEASQA